jgi:hypothetical protein
MAGRQAILFRAHGYSAGAAAELQRLCRQVGGGFDVWLIGFCVPAALAPFGHPHTLAYGVAVLSCLPYPPKLASTRWERATGSHDLPVLRFFRDHPDYERYWIIEYDVRYTGDWGALLADLSRSPAALLGTTVQRFADNPNWANWPSLNTCGEVTDQAQWIKAFMPFGCVDHAALTAIDAAYQRGWTGHAEAVWSTAVAQAGLRVEDIGGLGRFVPQGREGRYYWNSPLDPHLRPGSFVFRPTVEEGQIDQEWTGHDAATRNWVADQLAVPGRLVHPVKE